MEQEEYLDRYERILQDGLVKLCTGAGLLSGEALSCPDADGWWDVWVKDYIGDAVDNFNEYPMAAIGWAAFLGMGVAWKWDSAWPSGNAPAKLSYRAFYGSRGFDDMDEHIMWDLLGLTHECGRKVSDTVLSCAQAALGLIQHEGVETQTSLGFYVLSRTYSVMFRIGVAMELQRLGYRKVLLDPGRIVRES
ncbi:MAG: hypothetical protein MJY50_04995 [Bacteroidales bacterium]|nr:hypothetical protein [Bacteroidales bacterium]